MKTLPFQLPDAVHTLIDRLERILTSRPEDHSAGLKHLSYPEFELICLQHGVSSEDRWLHLELSHRDWMMTSKGLSYYGDLDVTRSDKSAWQHEAA